MAQQIFPNTGKYAPYRPGCNAVSFCRRAAKMAHGSQAEGRADGRLIRGHNSGRLDTLRNSGQKPPSYVCNDPCDSTRGYSLHHRTPTEHLLFQKKCHRDSPSPLHLFFNPPVHHHHKKILTLHLHLIPLNHLFV